MMVHEIVDQMSTEEWDNTEANQKALAVKAHHLIIQEETPLIDLIQVILDYNYNVVFKGMNAPLFDSEEGRREAVRQSKKRIMSDIGDSCMFNSEIPLSIEDERKEAGKVFAEMSNMSFTRVHLERIMKSCNRYLFLLMSQTPEGSVEAMLQQRQYVKWAIPGKSREEEIAEGIERNDLFFAVTKVILNSIDTPQPSRHEQVYSILFNMLVNEERYRRAFTEEENNSHPVNVAREWLDPTALRFLSNQRPTEIVEKEIHEVRKFFDSNHNVYDSIYNIDVNLPRNEGLRVVKESLQETEKDARLLIIEWCVLRAIQEANKRTL